ncbi:MAG TPA: SprT-like domain-containing protein [Chloroflexia bacterium]|nr:SprT-like domain-containing protein [Chloroflexia bacterium]
MESAATLPTIKVPITQELIEKLYNSLNLQHFGGTLPACRLELSRRLVRTAGKIWPRARLIRLSVTYHERYGQEELSNTILHEMIHLWLYEQGLPSGHTERFREKLAEVGLEGRVRALPVPPRPYRYLYRCPTCSQEFKTRRKINSSCGKCDSKYNPHHRFKLVKHLQ